jgi:hypothetical protein
MASNDPKISPNDGAKLSALKPLKKIGTQKLLFAEKAINYKI